MKEAADAAVAKKAVEEAVEKKKATEEAAKKKAAKEAAVRKMAAEEEVVKNKATEEAAAKKKATEEAAVKKAAEEATAKRKTAGEATARKKASEEAAKKTESGVVTVGSVRSLAVPSGSTPLAKRQFHGSWKPRYATRPFICHFLYCVCDFNLFSPMYNVPSSGRLPPSGVLASRVQPKLLSPRTSSKPNRVMRLSVVAGSRLPVWLLPRVPPCRQLPLVGPRPLRCYHGVPLMS
jgi:hypothetical protein